MARSTEIIGLEYFKWRVAERKKTEMGSGRSENDSGFNSASPGQMGKAGIVSERQRSPFEDACTFVEGYLAGQRFATRSYFFLQIDETGFMKGMTSN